MDSNEVKSTFSNREFIAMTRAELALMGRQDVAIERSWIDEEEPGYPFLLHVPVGMELTVPLKAMDGFFHTRTDEDRKWYAVEFAKALVNLKSAEAMLLKYARDVRRAANAAVAAARADGLDILLDRVSFKPTYAYHLTDKAWKDAALHVLAAVTIRHTSFYLRPTTSNLWVEEAADVVKELASILDEQRARQARLAEMDALGADLIVDQITLDLLAAHGLDAGEVLERVWKKQCVKPMPVTEANSLSVWMRYLAKWMHYRNHRSFATVGNTAVQVYRDDLLKYLTTGEEAESRDIDIEARSIANYLRPLAYADEQARFMTARGLARIPAAPFGDASVGDCASEILTSVEGFTPPLPDAVVLPVVREAHRWLDAPARDIVRLQDLLAAESGRELSKSGRSHAMQRVLEAFEFSPEEEGGAPWHPPFAQFLDVRSKRPATKKPNAMQEVARAPRRKMDDIFGTDRARRLISHLVAACTIVIRFQTGIRHGEIFSFAPGIGDDGWPVCIEREQSVSGAYEMFFVRGLLFKGEDEPVSTRWLLAGRLYDDTATPDAVRAILILNQLAAPWRARATGVAKDALLVQPGHKGIAHDPSEIRGMGQRTLAYLMKDFVEDNVDLSGLDADDEVLEPYVSSKGRCIQSRQWRKTWANWMIRVDKRLLPAISQQFHHRSVLLTQESYIGKDAMQLGLVESAAMTRAVSYMRRAMAGEPHVGGGMRKVAESEVDDLRERLAGLSGEAQEYEIRTWLLDRDIRIWFSPHGKCFIGIMPGDARCHAQAGTGDWSNQAPSFAHRTPKLCSGCPCFAVDEDDLPFWIERYVENRKIWEDAVESGLEVNYAVANERWQQSAKVLQSLKVDLGALDKWETRNATHC